ncbi:hypothetical protein [Aquabacterium sp.]|uniref:hypothetical protein n=1 Tax=Aquabacterium sp. TaxID=1872578 RepID=UPI003D6D06B2
MSAKNKNKPVAVAKKAGSTNKDPGTLLKCEVDANVGSWIQPSSCSTHFINADAVFPEVIFEFTSDVEGPYEWSWDIRWTAEACPQAHGKKRFKAKKSKLYTKQGKFTSNEKKWKADLGVAVGGVLTVTVKAGNLTFLRRVIILGKNPGEEKVRTELDTYLEDFKKEIAISKKIFQQESKFRHFYSDDMPLVSFDNGYGLGQITNPEPTYEQVWNWKAHVKHVVTSFVKDLRKKSERYFSSHPGGTEDQIDTETLVFYNGANHHYHVWSETSKTWVVNVNVICDPTQSNKGWNGVDAKNKGLSLADLQGGKGSTAVYTGRCYAEHVQNANK